jgi:branched-subunit amino acid ABC-type transport system permease component
LKLITEVAVFIAVTPLAWWVYSSTSSGAQLAFVAVIAVAAYLLRRFVYKPLYARLPE